MQFKYGFFDGTLNNDTNVLSTKIFGVLELVKIPGYVKVSLLYYHIYHGVYKEEWYYYSKK